MVKPGYRTSEFWFTLVSFLFSGLYLLGIIGDSSQKEDLIRDVSHGVESVILIGGQLAILWKYINSRKEIKKTWETTTDEHMTNAPVVPKKRTRTTKKTTKKKPTTKKS